MLKQILGKLPGNKSSKSTQGNHLHESSGGRNPNSDVPGRNPNSGPSLIQARFSNGVKTTPFPVGGTGNEFSEPLPSFKDVASSEKQNLLIRKLSLCCVVFDFTDPTKNVKEKEIKRQTLLELVEYIGSYSGKFSELFIEELTKMVMANAFRTFPPFTHENTGGEVFDPEEDEPSMEPSWPHLQHVYDIFIRFLMSAEMDPKPARRYINHPFILKLINLFDSEDGREREYLKMILHRIYGKFMVYRPFIRKSINNVLYRLIFETERQNGVAELLEILGSIINGFALPLKEEHKLFLVRVLIPLHKPKCVSIYHRQLTYCITQFVDKELKLTDTVIRGLLKYWPVTNTQKEVLFLGELEEVLEATQPAEFQRCMVPLFKQIAKCLNSSHFQVAEKALFLWNNDHIVSLFTQNLQVLVPLIFPALEMNARGHWNPAVQSLTLNTRKLIMDLDAKLFERCRDEFEEEYEVNKKAMLERRELRWKRLDALASKSTQPAPSLITTQTLTLTPSLAVVSQS